MSQVQKNFSSQAHQYSSRAKLQRTVATKLSYLISPNLNQNSKVIDIGSGTAFLSQIMPNVDFTNVDFSLPMCGISSEISPSICADMHYMPIKQNSFDVAVSSLALQWSQNLPEVFSQISQTLKPSGVFVFSIVAQGTLKNFQNYLKAKNINNPINNFHSKASLSKLLSKDFIIENIFEKSEPIGSQTPYQILKSISSIGASASLSKNIPSISQLKSLINDTTSIEDSWDIIYFICKKK